MATGGKVIYSAGDRPSVKCRGNPWIVLLGCFLLSVAVNSYVISPSSITPLFANTFDVSTTQVNSLVSISIVGMVVVQLPGGYLIDRFDNRWLLVPAVVLFGCVLIGSQLGTSVSDLVVPRLIAGGLGGIIFTTCANIVGAVFDPGREELATGIYISSPPSSYVISHTTSPFIGAEFGPLSVFLLHAAIAMVGLVAFLLGVDGKITTSGAPTGGEFLRAVGNRAVLLVSLCSATMYAIYVFLNTWIPTYGVEVLSLPLHLAGLVTAVVPLMGLLARPGGGWASHAIGGLRKPVLAAGLGVTSLGIAVLSVPTAVVLFALLLTVLAFFLQVGFGLVYTVTRELATAGTEGTSLTVLTTLSLTGSLVAPLAGGWILEAWSWPLVFLAFSGVGVLGLAALYPLQEPGMTRGE